MAYCKSCGAYIPDGQSVCLACGYDDAAERKKTEGPSASAARQSGAARADRQVDSDFLKKQLEEQRRRQQENSRKWAETEFQQRQKARQEQDRSFGGASSGENTRYRHTVRDLNKKNDTSKIFAGLSYFSGLFILPYLFRKDDAFATYHAKQGLNLFVAGIIGDIAGGILGVGWVVTLARLYMIYKGVSNVVNDKKAPLPYIGDIIK